MFTRLLILVGLGVLAAGAAWQRHVMTPKGDRRDTPLPHSLAYFTEYPMLRDESGDFCQPCSPEKRLAEAKKEKGATEIRLVGALAGFEIYDLYYRFKCEGCVDWKSILVKTGQDQYREIYHVQPAQVDARAESSVLFDVGQDRLLGARYSAGGNKGMYSDDYYWFDEDGALPVDFGPIRKAAIAALPRNYSLWGGGDDNGPRTLAMSMFKFWVQEKGGWLCCGRGAVIVRFRLDRGKAVVTSAVFDSSGGPDYRGRKQ